MLFHSFRQRKALSLCKCSKPEGTDVTIFSKRRNPSLLEKRHGDLPSCGDMNEATNPEWSKAFPGSLEG